MASCLHGLWAVSHPSPPAASFMSATLRSRNRELQNLAQKATRAIDHSFVLWTSVNSQWGTGHRPNWDFDRSWNWRKFFFFWWLSLREPVTAEQRALKASSYCGFCLVLLYFKGLLWVDVHPITSIPCQLSTLCWFSYLSYLESPC